jgi:hypothetical protein
VFSFLTFNILTRTGYQYFAFLFQFAGVVSLLNGFLLFIIERFGLSFDNILIYSLGYIGFFAVTTRILREPQKLMKKKRNQEE